MFEGLLSYTKGGKESNEALKQDSAFQFDERLLLRRLSSLSSYWNASAEIKGLNQTFEQMRAKRVDENQKQIVEDLRKLHYSVAITSMVGNGFPDIVVGAAGVNYLFELKDEKKFKSQKKLTDPQKKLHEGWRGKIYKVENLEEIVRILNGKK